MPNEDDLERMREEAARNMTPEQNALERKLFEKLATVKPTPDELKALKEDMFKARLKRAANADDPHLVIRECVERIAEAAREIYAAMRGPHVAITIHTSEAGAMVIGYGLRGYGDALGRSKVFGVNGVAITVEPTR